MPKVVEHDLKREEIADAVTRTIARLGIDAATVREIAREVGCSTGVLAHYFPDKDALLLHALRLATARAGGRMARHAGSERGITALRAVLREALPLDDSSRQEWRVWLCFWGRATQNAALATEQRRRYAEWRALVRRLIRDAQKCGDVPGAADAAHEADVLVVMIDGIGLQATLEPERLTPKRQVDMVERHLRQLQTTDRTRK